MIEIKMFIFVEIEDILFCVFIVVGMFEVNVRFLVVVMVVIEVDGVVSYGFVYILIYCEYVICGKVDG